MLSLRELRRAARIIQDRFAGALLRRIAQRDDYALILTFEKSPGKSHILLACRPDFARICELDSAGPTISPGSFCQYASAHLPGSSLLGIEASEGDRQIGLHLQSRSGLYELIFSILGARSNIYLVDDERELVHSLRPLAETRRELNVGQVWRNPQGRAPFEGEDRWEDVPDAGYLESITHTYRQLEQRREIDLLSRKIDQAIKKEREFLGRKSINLREDLRKARQAEITRRKGELLKSILHTIGRGADRVFAIDYLTGEVVEIPLDPRISPAANMESYFARYQKETRGAKIIQQQLEDLEAKCVQLDVIGQRLEEALNSNPPDVEALQRLLSHGIFRGLTRRQYPGPKSNAPGIKSKAKKEIPARLLPKRYKTQQGLEIWVGRSDEGNDYLTTRMARGKDLFFHLEGYPGSHVVLRTEGRLDAPPDSILDACELAVHFSKLKNTNSADVHVAPIKNVKKPKGAKPGLVFVRDGRTIHLRRDPRRLEGILSARLD